MSGPFKVVPIKFSICKKKRHKIYMWKIGSKTKKIVCVCCIVECAKKNRFCENMYCVTSSFDSIRKCFCSQNDLIIRKISSTNVTHHTNAMRVRIICKMPALTNIFGILIKCSFYIEMKNIFYFFSR